MNLYNRIEIFGRVTKDPEIRESVNENGVNYRLVWDIAQYQGKDDTAFWSCVMFGNLDYLEKESNKLHKGRRTYVAGQAIKKRNETKTGSGAVIISESVIVQVRDIVYCDGKLDMPEEEDTGTSVPEMSKDEDPDGFRDISKEQDAPEFGGAEEESDADEPMASAEEEDLPDQGPDPDRREVSFE